MSTPRLSLVFAAFAFSPWWAAAAPATTPVRTPIGVEQTYEVSFPITLLAEGVSEGEVRVIVEVEATGRLADWLIIGYTHRQLADLTHRSMRDWRYRAAKVDGQPVSAQTQLTFQYRAEGVVVSQNAVEHFLASLRGPGEPRLILVPRSLRELDRIPLPLAMPAPLVAPAMIPAGTRPETTVEFYIDDTGTVRMPVIIGGDTGHLAAAAIDAVRQWKFEPPTAKGRPVLVQASQQFLFNPAP